MDSHPPHGRMPLQMQTGADHHQDGREDEQSQHQRGRTKLSPPLHIPKNRSTGNLAVAGMDHADRARLRFSFDAGAAAAEYDAITRSPIMTDHDHGLGLSGLRRIRQQPPMRNPTVPSSTSSSRSPSTSTTLPRSTSMIMFPHPHGLSHNMSSVPSSPNFSEDLARFPSESLHSFSFANQSEEYIHSRQNVLKRSLEFMKDRMGWAVTSQAGIASAQARVTGDVEAQNALDLLAKAQLVGANNIPGTSSAITPGPLTGPAVVSAENIFDSVFVPRSTSPDPLSPTNVRERPRLGGAGAGTAEAGATQGGLAPELDSDNSSRTPTNESGTTAKTSPPHSRRPSLKRTLTDTSPASMHQRLIDVMAQPIQTKQQQSLPEQLISPTFSVAGSLNLPSTIGGPVHGHATRWVPAAQAIFTTEAKPPWTILAANDLACLVFGVTKAEVRRMGILQVVQEERRDWIEKKLLHESPRQAIPSPEEDLPQLTPSTTASSILGSRGGGITAKLLSKPNSRSQTPKSPTRRSKTAYNGDMPPADSEKGKLTVHHGSSKSRGVILCGDVVPIQKRNGATGSASLWVKEKRVGLIWVLEEIHEDVAYVALDDDALITNVTGDTAPIWGDTTLNVGDDIGKFIPRIPRQGIDPRFGELDYAQIMKKRFYTCRNCDKVHIPASLEQVRGKTELRVSSFPHIAGIVVVDTSLNIKSSNSVFCGALFGHEKPDGLPITSLIPGFDKILQTLVEDDGVQLVDGVVVPEHSFRKAAAFLGFREGRADASANFLRPEGLPAKHRDGSELKVDVQMRVVMSERNLADTTPPAEEDDEGEQPLSSESEMCYALWITYSRHLHASGVHQNPSSPMLSGTATPLHQPSPGQTPAHTPMEIQSDVDEPKKSTMTSLLAMQLKEAAINAAAKLTGHKPPEKTARARQHQQHEEQQRQQPAVAGPATTATATTAAGGAAATEVRTMAPPRRKHIDDFAIIEDMGQGAYGQVKLARHKATGHKVVLKYVTKRRILVDTWARDRRLGTVPLEIHVLDYLRREGLRHPNIVEMDDFFEDNVNYYIEMVPHGLPGMDLFDYIELRTNMDEAECRSIFVQVARAVHHLHAKALVVHRDIKDENVILDGEGNIKLIDFGSAAYIKSGPFDVFVGTIDYAAPEVLAGKPYGGREQDVWALGILLYTILYKENPFYSIDEIMDRDLRVPYIISDDSIDLVRCMLNRDVKERFDIDGVLEHPWCKAAAPPPVS